MAIPIKGLIANLISLDNSSRVLRAKVVNIQVVRIFATDRKQRLFWDDNTRMKYSAAGED